jgi:hypothetical protein
MINKEQMYSSAGKQEFRAHLRNFIHIELLAGMGRAVKSVRVLCLPSAYGREIEEVYAPLGITDNQIVAVEHDAAQIPRIIKKHPSLMNVHKLDVCTQLSDVGDGPFDVLSFDLCRHFDLRLFSQLAVAEGIMQDSFVLTTTMMKGREHASVKAGIQSFNPFCSLDEARHRAVKSAVHRYLCEPHSMNIVASEHYEYISAFTPFMCDIFKIERGDDSYESRVFLGPKRRYTSKKNNRSGYVRTLIDKGCSTDEILRRVPDLTSKSVDGIRAAYTREIERND